MNSFEDALRSLQAMPARFEELFRLVPVAARSWQPEDWGGIPGERFSAVGQLCHLRDIEIDGYHRRFRRVLDETHPALESVDGYALAESRRYAQADAEQAMQAFRQARELTLSMLQNLDDQALARRCRFEEYGELSLAGLVQVLCSHDQQHLACMHWLLAKIGSAGKA